MRQRGRGLAACAAAVLAGAVGVVSAEPTATPTATPTVAPASTPPAAPASSVEVVAPAPMASSPPRFLGYGAMPGGLHVGAAQALPVGAVAVASVVGYGRRTGLLGAGHILDRGIGQLAAAYQASEFLAVGLSLDGRYDRHYGVTPSGDDGWVGDPKLLVAVAHDLGGFAVGGRLNLWLPGKSAPSIDLGAATVDLRGQLGVAAGPAWLSFEAGFRLDRSAQVVDAPGQLTPQDQVSLGVSSFNAVVGGARALVPVGAGFVAVEGSADLFLGAGAPGPIVRGGLSGGLPLGGGVSALGFVEVALDPSIAASAVTAGMVPLIAYEPAFSLGVGLSTRFGGPTPVAPIIPIKPPIDVDAGHKDPVKVEVAALAGKVVDPLGAPVAGAKVTITVGDKVADTETDVTGGYRADGLPLGEAKIAAALDGKKPGAASTTLAAGDNAAPPITLEPTLPDGQVRGIIRAFRTGKPVVGATVSVEPGGAKATVGADGTFVINVAPGQYKLTVSAPGLTSQSLDVTVDPDGVSIKNIDLRGR
jgi:hypothetical protein